jgi:hypothetical protein
MAMSKKNESQESHSYANTDNSNTNVNNNTNTNDISESINRSLDEAKDSIKKTIDESKNQIPRYNSIVNSYQEQSLQTAREISEGYIDSQKQVISSLQSAWRPYNESFNGFITKWSSSSSSSSPDSITEAYAKFVSNIADSTVSAVRLANCVMFSNLDSMKSVLQQAKDNSKHLSSLSVNTAKTFEQASKKMTAAVQDAGNSNHNSD